MPAQQTFDSVAVHPLVLLSVVDHAARITKGAKKRVLGVLLGSESTTPAGTSELQVTNSFAGVLILFVLLLVVSLLQ